MKETRLTCRLTSTSESFFRRAEAPRRIAVTMQGSSTRSHNGHGRRTGACAGGETAIPAYALKVLWDDGSEQLSERFDHPLVSFEVSCVL